MIFIIILKIKKTKKDYEKIKIYIKYTIKWQNE